MAWPLTGRSDRSNHDKGQAMDIKTSTADYEQWLAKHTEIVPEHLEIKHQHMAWRKHYRKLARAN
jgi:hypothetical protein